MSVLKKQFNYELNQSSPIQLDYNRHVSFDEDGNEVILYELVNYPKEVLAKGKAEDWNLNNLIKAGIDPKFPIYTGYTTRLQGIEQINRADAYAEDLINEEETEKTE